MDNPPYYGQMLLLKASYVNHSIPNYQNLLDEVKNFGVALDEDPSSQSLSVLNTKISSIDAQQTRVARILGTAIQNESEIGLLVDRLTGIRTREFNKLLVSNEIKTLANKELREAAVGNVLCELDELMSDIEGSHSRAKSFTKIIKNIFDMLDITNKNISRQVTVLQLQMDIGEIARKETNANLKFGNKG
jgi:hypothetical protein